MRVFALNHSFFTDSGAFSTPYSIPPTLALVWLPVLKYSIYSHGYDCNWDRCYVILPHV